MKKIVLNENKPWWSTYSDPVSNSKNAVKLFMEKRTSLGKETLKLENIIKKKLKVKHVILSNSGTSALYMATIVANIHKRKNVYSPAINWPGSINGVLYAGKKLHLIDSKKNFINSNYNSILKKISKNDLLFISHLNGKCAYEIEMIKEWKKKNFFIIEDAAQSFMTKDFNNKFVGTRFDIGCFSLGMTKMCNMIYGGFCATNNSKYAKELIKIRNNGVDNIYQKPNGIGGNFKPSDLHSIVGINSVNSFQVIKKKLFKIFNVYKKKLINKNFLMFDYNLNKGEMPTYVEILTKKRSKLIIYMKKNNIGFSYGTRMLNLSKNFSIFNNIKNAKKFDNELLRLPCGPGLSLKQVKETINILNKFN